MKNKNNNEIIKEYLIKQASLDTLRLITCGSVDDGKSTLIGRILYETKVIFEDQIADLKKESNIFGTQGNEIDFALLVDGLEAERAQGITIDVAYRFFTTDKRKFIVSDTPGHEQYTRNMVTGASNTDLAIILIDARHGVLEQTRRHSSICSILGIKNILVAINKIDLVDYSEKVFIKIKNEFQIFSKKLDFKDIAFIPISALKGDNVIKRSNKTPWFIGPTLIGYLETVDPQAAPVEKPFCCPVQWVNRPNLDFRGYSGIIESGNISVGQNVLIMPSGEKVKIKDIIIYKTKLSSAKAGQSVTFTFDSDVDVSRGDIIVGENYTIDISDQFEVQLIWMSKDPGFVGRSYLMKIGTSTVNAQITNIKYKININTSEKISAKKLELNDLCVVTLSVDKSIPFDVYKSCKSLGSFILIDRINNLTLAGGLITFGLRRAKNLHQPSLDIDKLARQSLNGHKSKVIWFTGLSGSGKSTIANALEKKLHSLGIRTYILDGDNIRQGLNKDLGFTDADRIENIRRISEVAKLMVDSGLVVITAFISPFRAEREMARSIFEKDEFIEIYVDTSLEVAETRDPKGLYKKARRGEIPNFTGIDSPYEVPLNPDIQISTENKNVETIVKYLIKKVGFDV